MMLTLLSEERKVKPFVSFPSKRVVSYEKLCRAMVSSLTEDQKEHAARSSYKYLTESLSTNTVKKRVVLAEREKHAIAMARRHLVAEKGDVTTALRKMQKTIEFRKKNQVDDLRRCFYERVGHDDAGGLKYEHMRCRLEEQLETGKAVVQGYDKEDRALYLSFPRLVNSWDPEWCTKIYCYLLERAIACTERASGGREEKVNVVFDYTGYNSSHAPPLKLAKELMFCLRDHYPERLHRVYILDAPFVFRAFWSLFKPFIDPVTKSKIRFATGHEQKQKEFRGFIDEEEAMPFMLSKGQKTKEFNTKEFLYDIPFDHAYDE